MQNKVKKDFSLNKDLEDSILMFHYKMISEIRRKSKEIGFTSSQLEILHYVAEKVNPTMKEIAEHLQIKPPSVTTLVEALCKKKLLKREINNKDKRIVRISFTENIWKVFKSIKNKKHLILKDLFSRLSYEDKKEVVRIISVLNKK